MRPEIRLEPVGDGLPRQGQWRNGFAVADMNGDGLPDLLHGPARKGSGRPIVFLGDGSGSFAPWAGARFPELEFDYGDAAAADFNGDGHLDAAFGVHLRGLVALAGDGRGGFEPLGEGLELDDSGKAEFSSRAVAAADWNGDGRTDLVALGEGPRPDSMQGSRGLAVYLNSADGTWRRLRADPPMRAFGDSLAIADLDGDGRLDAVAASRRPSPEEVLLLQGEQGLWTATPSSVLRADAYFVSVAAADLDGSGRTDVALAFLARAGGGWTAGVDLLFQSADGVWERRELAGARTTQELSALAVGDFDADGRADLATGSSSGELRLFRGLGEGSFELIDLPPLGEAGEGCKAYHLRFADLDARPGDELLAGFAGESFPGFEDRCRSGGSLQAWRIVVSRSPPGQVR